LQKKYPAAGKAWAWQWVFPQARRFVFILFSEDKPNLAVDDVFRRILMVERFNFLSCSQGFRIITRAILYRGNLLVCCTGVAYGEATFSLLLRYPRSQPV